MLNAFYDLAVSPPSFDFLSFLAGAERHRLALGEENMRVIVVAGPDHGFRLDQLPPRDPKTRRRMLEKIVFKLCGLVPSCVAVEECKDRASVASYKTGPVYPVGYDERNPASHYGTKMIFDAVRAGCMPFRADMPTKKNDKLLTITLRETPYWPTRNSNISEWQKVARHFMNKGHDVKIVRDTANATRALPGFTTFPDASMSLQARLKLYEDARLNLFVNNGPAWLGLLAANVSLFICKMESPDAPCVNADFFKACGLARGEQLDRPNCRILWADDKADLIVPAVEDMLATLPLSTEALEDCA